MAEERAALDFWEITNLRRVELGKKWKDVLAETELSHETLNRWRKGLKVDPLTDRAFERALLWAAGAREAAAAGVGPQVLSEPITESGPPATPSLSQELEVARQAIAALVDGLKLTPEQAEEAFRRVQADIVRTHTEGPSEPPRERRQERRTG